MQACQTSKVSLCKQLNSAVFLRTLWLAGALQGAIALAEWALSDCTVPLFFAERPFTIA
jgi:hypothetical protein